MREYDIIIIGASTTGSWFAKQMSARGFKVLVLEKQKRENISRNYDIFHMGKKEMEKFGYPIPNKNDVDYAFEFVGGSAFSAYGNYPKPSYTEIVGMHKHEYILRLNDDAIKAGSEIIYEAAFDDFIFDERGRIIGAKYTTADGEQQAYAKIVADCSGIPSAARTKLPDGYGVENFEISPRDMFYVVLYYVKYPKGHEKVIHTDSYLQYKAWSAPQADPEGAILGVGANLSFEYAEEMFKEFQKNVPWCEYEIQHIEKGRTPYRRPPYSFVSDGFIAMGDAACLTKPNNGEGCTSALYQARIAVDVITDALRGGGYITKARLWKINKEYIEVQGKAFASLMATLIGAAVINCTENEYFFEHDIVFSKKMFAGLSEGISLSAGEIASMAANIAKGVATGKIRPSTLKSVIGAAKNGMEIKAHYSKFPSTPNGFEEWCLKANRLWAKIGSMADNCDEEIIARIAQRKTTTA